MKEISFLDIFASIRPYKNLFLIPSNASFDFVRDEAIPWLSGHWGGPNQFFMPVTDSLEKDPNFHKWISLIRKFDPDFVVSLGQFPVDFLDLVKSYTLSKSDHFQFAPQVGSPTMLQYGLHGCEIEKVYETLVQPNNQQWESYSNSGDLILDVWFLSQFGRNEPTLTSSAITVTKLPMTATQIESNVSDISRQRFPNNFKGSPSNGCMNLLGGRYMNGISTKYNLPNIIIVGDSISDWALFQSLRYMYFDVYWIPTSKLATVNGKISSFDVHFFDKLTDNNKRDAAWITSASHSEVDLQKIVTDLQTVYTRSVRAGNVRYKIQMDFNEVVTNWLKWSELNNTKESSVTFDGNISVQNTPYSPPKHFKPNIDGAKFYISIVSDNYSYLTHPYAVEEPVLWKNQKAVLSEDARREYDGGLSFNPIRHLSFGHQDIDSVLHGPKMKRINLFTDLNDIFKVVNLSPKRSIKSLNFISTMKLWDDSFAEFYKDFFAEDSSKIFQTFKSGRDHAKRVLGLNNSAGIEMRKKFYFSYLDVGQFAPALASVDSIRWERWLQKQILIRGERLVCLKCGWQDFYSEDLVSGAFTCKRCDSVGRRSSETMQGDEPRFLYGLSPLVYGLIEHNSELNALAGHKLKAESKFYFEIETEIELYNEEKRCVQEIDVLANQDGKLILGEAKSNGKLNGTQLTDYVSLCEKVRPDIFAVISLVDVPAASKTHIEQAFAKIPNGPKVKFITI